MPKVLKNSDYVTMSSFISPNSVKIKYSSFPRQSRKFLLRASSSVGERRKPALSLLQRHPTVFLGINCGPQEILYLDKIEPIGLSLVQESDPVLRMLFQPTILDRIQVITGFLLILCSFLSYW
jgi:hypothetical protein